MRAKAKIVGMGARVSGVSKKNGRPYDFTPFHLVYQDKNVEGFAAARTLVDQSILDPIPLPKVNEEVEIVYHFNNGSLTVDAIL